MSNMNQDQIEQRFGDTKEAIKAKLDKLTLP
jgi:hypothetical protein